MFYSCELEMQLVPFTNNINYALKLLIHTLENIAIYLVAPFDKPLT